MKTIQLIVAILLFPLSIWYAVGVAFRNLYYDHRDKKNSEFRNQNSEFDIATIGIGNLRMGGTGKTPHTEYLIRLLSKYNIHNSISNIALLSRGYRRKTKGFLIADKNATAARIGDEPLMMHRKFPDITVAVCEDRAEGLRQLHNSNYSQSTIHNPQFTNIVLLDDAFQHRRVRPDINILLTEYGDLYRDDLILPFGNLREPRRGSRRADIIVVTKCPPFLSSKKQERIRQHLNPAQNQKLFFSCIAYSDPVPLFSQNSEFNFQNSTLLLVSGIANPEPLKRHLERHSTVRHLSFPDHHDFSRLDCELIVKRFEQIIEPSKAIVTTEKDAMRLMNCPHRHLFDDIPFFFIPIEVKFLNQNDFDNTIRCMMNDVFLPTL